MSDFNPHGLPKDLLQRIEILRPIIEADHAIEDSHNIEGHIICACGTVFPYLDYVLHINNELARIIDLET